MSRDLLAAATPRPWFSTSKTAVNWQADIFAETGCVAQYASVADAKTIVAAVNEYEALLDLRHDVARLAAFHAAVYARRTTKSAQIEDFLGDIATALARLDAIRASA